MTIPIKREIVGEKVLLHAGTDQLAPGLVARGARSRLRVQVPVEYPVDTAGSRVTSTSSHWLQVLENHVPYKLH